MKKKLVFLSIKILDHISFLNWDKGYSAKLCGRITKTKLVRLSLTLVELHESTGSYRI